MRRKGKDYMNTENITTTATQAEQPALVKQIGKTTYKVKVHFSETSKETMSDKIVRMLKSEISQMQSLS